MHLRDLGEKYPRLTAVCREVAEEIVDRVYGTLVCYEPKVTKARVKKEKTAVVKKSSKPADLSFLSEEEQAILKGLF